MKKIYKNQEYEVVKKDKEITRKGVVSRIDPKVKERLDDMTTKKKRTIVQIIKQMLKD